MIRTLSPWLALLLLAGAAQAQSEVESFFETRIRPVLAGTCFKCHGGNKVNAGLRVDTRQALLRGGQSGPALAPGAPERSLLIQALRHSAQAEIKMPPNQKLPDSTIADFERWVKEGAIWPAARPAVDAFAAGKHWAFVCAVLLPVMLAAGKAEMSRGIPSGSLSLKEGIMSEPFPHAPDQTAIHGPESAGSPVAWRPNALDREIDTFGTRWR